MFPPLARFKATNNTALRAAPLLVAPMVLALVMMTWLVAPFGPASAAPVAPTLPPNASCAQLARIDQTATNGAAWGVTLLPGHGAPGGWFGVPICANGVNHSAPGGANVSCDRVPFSYTVTRCAPGRATTDGYGLTFQCVELVVRFSAWAFGSAPSSWRGDAPYLWLSGHHPANFTPYANGGTRAPVPGDILVWGTLSRSGKPWPAGPAGGHVAVVAAAGAGSMTLVEENMLGAGGDIPEETTSLIERGGHWWVGPTYGLNGGRALYGWLHETHNSGHVLDSHLQVSPKTPPAPPSPPQLAGAIVVTGAGSLAELVWSDTHTPAPSGRQVAKGAPAPSAVAESLGAPHGVTLAPDQVPATVTLPMEARYAFARGQDGALYAVYTDPTEPEPLWQTLGAPPNVTLTGTPSALWDGATLTVGAVGSDGALWVRSGPPGMLDQWVSVGAPGTGVARGVQTSAALARQPRSRPASSATSGAALALAVGRDGALYESDRNAGGGWGAWAATTITGLSAPLTGNVLALPEPMPAVKGRPAGAAPTVGAVDAIVADAAGRLWLLRRAALTTPWQARAVVLPDANASLAAATISTADAADPLLTLFVTDPQISPAPQPGAQDGESAMAPAQAGVLVSQVGLIGTSKPAWALLGYTGGPADSSLAPIGQGLRAVAVATSDQIVVNADGAARELLAHGATPAPLPAALDSGQPGGAAMATAPAAVAGAGSVVAGTVPAPFSFADPFAGGALDPRWTITGAQPNTVAVVSGALALTASQSSSETAAMQGAPASGFSLTVRVTPGAPWPAGAQAGVRLALDNWNMVTLAVASGGRVTLCPVVNGQAAACDTATISHPANADQGVYLRISSAGDLVSASVSADGVSWSSLGYWQIPWASAAQGSARGAYAPPVANASAHIARAGYAALPLLFSSMAFVVDGGSARFSWMALTASGTDA